MRCGGGIRGGLYEKVWQAIACWLPYKRRRDADGRTYGLTVACDVESDEHDSDWVRCGNTRTDLDGL